MGAKDKGNIITMVCPHMGWSGMLDEAGPMLELIEVDRSMGTWR